MKRSLYLIPGSVLILLMAVLFWDPIVDFLPINQSGWITTDLGQIYLDKDGDPVSGWYEIDGNSYYFDPSDNTLYTGWADDRYVVSGLPCSGWTNTPDGRYFLKTDGSIHTGWLEDSGKRFYLDKEGQPLTGWVSTQEGLYYLKSDGSVATGLTKTDKGTYCFNNDGTPHSGWYEQEGKRYFAQSDGALHLGWLEQGGNAYYMKDDGSAAVGKLVIDGQTYFFSSKGVRFILVNPWNELPEGFVANLEAFEGTHGDPVCKDDMQQMLSDCRAEGLYPRILSGHRSVADQTYNFNVSLWNYVAKGYSRDAAYDMVRKNIAVPGTSEHHLGLGFDIVDARYPKLEEPQEEMATQQWLMEHSWEYGFILRYPQGTTEITGIVYEPWHYRYVGREMAAEIHALGITLEEYVDMLTNDGTTCGGTPSAETEEE